MKKDNVNTRPTTTTTTTITTSNGTTQRTIFNNVKQVLVLSFLCILVSCPCSNMLYCEASQSPLQLPITNSHKLIVNINIPNGGASWSSSSSSRSTSRYIQPTALVKISDVEDLQNEVLRLRNILKENGIYCNGNDTDNDDDENDADNDADNNDTGNDEDHNMDKDGDENENEYTYPYDHDNDGNNLKKDISEQMKISTPVEDDDVMQSIIHNDNDNDNDNENETTVEVKKTATTTATIDNICPYICHVINERLIQVTNKDRSKWFNSKYKKYLDSIDGEYTIVSGHGRAVQAQEVEDKEDDEMNKKQQQQQEHQQQQQELIESNIDLSSLSLSSSLSSYFPSNILSLDMVFTKDMYNIAKNEIYTKQKNENLDHHSMYEKELLFIPRLIVRAIQLGINFTPVTMTIGLASLSKTFRDGVWYNLVSKCLANSGPAFIKWGQWASTRSDMFPDALCRALSDLHADAPAHSWKVTQKTVEEALCIPKGTLYQVFEEFDQSPVASGSIAQVHRAVLRPNHNPMAAIEMEMNDSKKESQSNNNNNKNNKRRKNQNKNKSNGSDNDNDSQNNAHRGTSVAIKVRHPNVSRLIDMDFRLMSIIADVADCIPALSWLRVRESVEQFSHTMAAQAHLNVEAHHLEVLNHNFRHWDTVQFPSPLFACSSVIIESFEKGNICSTTIDKYDSLAEAKAAAASTRKSSSDYPIVEEVNEEGEEVNYEDNESGHELMPVPLAKFIVTTGLSIYLKMLLVDNLMHADLHPGNIMLDYQLYGDQFGDNSLLLNNVEDIPVGGASSSCSTVRNRDRSSKRERGRKVRSDKKKSTAAKVSNDFYGRISLVDAGMVAQLDDDESTNFIGLISALGEGDGRAAAEAILRFKNNIGEYEGDNDHNNLTLLEREGFIEDVIDLFEERCRGYGTNVDFGSVLRGVLGIVKKHHIQLGANYATLVVNALCIESLAKRVCPSYNVLDASKPLLKAYGVLTHDDSNSKKGFFSNRPELRRSLIRAFTPILYMKKRRDDDKFFKNIEMKRRSELKGKRQSKSPFHILRLQSFKRLRKGNPAGFLGRKKVTNFYKNQVHRKVILVGTMAFAFHHTASILMIGEEPKLRQIQDEELLGVDEEKEDEDEDKSPGSWYNAY